MNSNTRPTLRIVVLAAGLSTRLGSPKPLARIRGMSLLRHTVQLLAPLTASRVIVVIAPRAARARAELRRLRVTFVENAERARGLSTSVRRGLTAARFGAAVLLLPVDLALLKRRDLARLAAHWSGARRRVIARRLEYGGTPFGGTPLIVPRWLYGRALGIAGDSGLKELIGHLPRSEVELLDLPSAAWDVDTAQDLARARRRTRP